MKSKSAAARKSPKQSVKSSCAARAKPVSRTASVSRSTANRPSVAAGKTPTDPLTQLKHTLKLCWREQVRVKSDYARKAADIIAMAASLRLITTKVGPQRFAKTWHITTKGLAWLNEKED
jgi:hypothetical protein